MKMKLLWALGAAWLGLILVYIYQHETREVFAFALAAAAAMIVWVAVMARRGMFTAYYLGAEQQSRKLFLSSMFLIAAAWAALLIASPVTDPLLVATINTVLPLGLLLHFVLWWTAGGRKRR